MESNHLKTVSDPIDSDKKAAVFNKTYKDYLYQLAELDPSKIAQKLGLERSGNGLLVSLFNSEYHVSPKAVLLDNKKKAGFEKSIILFKYLLMCPAILPEGSDWVVYHSFKNAQPLLHYFAREVTRAIEKTFSGDLSSLEKAGNKLGGNIVKDNAAYDISMQFEALPKIPIFMRFNDKDEDFPAKCTILFQSTVDKYLDMESLGILGALFAKELKHLK